ncbi:MAG TPA: glutamate-1-semialdehyde 2,1-aminomutase [Candidatus Tripitaka californicus]|uniref:glutamate-1-semialdehyde 2,1-aminomutase n=1 Tax=Candidatus Tripitaka californicus TaxID=3367616 RepID=UPI00402A53CE|nr:glutamate-1-semialdehyde 2,1-aminomutase [Planctomycetota bacterium]
MEATTKKLNTRKSEKAFKEAQKHIPGGVNSPVRAFGPVGGHPIFFKSGSGCHVTDIDGNSYIDYVCSWGPLILGHAHPGVIRKIKSTASKGTSFGAPTVLETKLARLIKGAVPSIEKVRFVNSGTEATMSAIRLARAFTGRELVVKFEGCYHGHVDGLLIKAGSGAATLGIPTSPGIPQGYASTTVVLPYNSLQSVETLCKERGREIACIILEPVAGNMGVVPPVPGYLEGLWKLTRANGIVLIFDEVMSGFRVSPGGAQELYGIRPDLTTLGKIIGGGLPVGAYGGRADIMDKIAPLGAVYQAGTLSGNPVAMAAGVATLEALKDASLYEKLEESSRNLAEGLERAARDSGVKTFHTRVGSMLCTFFTENKVTDWDSAKTSDTQRYAAYFRGMLERGVYLAPSQFEAAFVSVAHGGEDIEATVKAGSEVMKGL